jgi:hypothetical protein
MTAARSSNQSLAGFTLADDRLSKFEDPSLGGSGGFCCIGGGLSRTAMVAPTTGPDSFSHMLEASESFERVPGL